MRWSLAILWILFNKSLGIFLLVFHCITSTTYFSLFKCLKTLISSALSFCISWKSLLLISSASLLLEISLSVWSSNHFWHNVSVTTFIGIFLFWKIWSSPFSRMALWMWTLDVQSRIFLSLKKLYFVWISFRNLLSLFIYAINRFSWGFLQQMCTSHFNKCI